MYYYRARYYAPQLGRFLQTDPVGYKDDLDLYTYVYNDPLNKVDPTGMQTRMDQDFDRDAYAVLSGKMSPQQFSDNNKARADGALIGLAVILAPQTTVKALVTNTTVGAAVGGAVAGIEGKPIGKGAADGAESAAATTIAGANAGGRLAKAAAVGSASAAATEVEGGDKFEIAISGVVSGIVEFVTKNETKATSAGTAAARFFAPLIRQAVKKGASSGAKEAFKKGCELIHDDTQC